MNQIRILVADDHEVVRRGIRDLLEERANWKVVGEAVTGREAVEKTKELNPEIIIMDLAMPGLNGLEATREIVRVAPQANVLILTVHESEDLAQEVLAAGAHGYIFKSDAGRDLLNAVEALSENKPFFTARIANMVLETFRKRDFEGKGKSGSGVLTSRERQVLQLLAEGKNNRKVARDLHISIKTVEAHRANIMRKLGIKSLCGLVHYAIRNKIINP